MGWLDRGNQGRDHQMAFLKVDPRLAWAQERRDFGRVMDGCGIRPSLGTMPATATKQPPRADSFKRCLGGV